MIVLSSDRAVQDLLDKRSNIYSDRPDMYLTHVIGNENRMLSMVRPIHTYPAWKAVVYVQCVSDQQKSHTVLPGVCSASSVMQL